MSIIYFKPFPTRTTARLQLRQIKPEDEAEIFLLRSDENVNRYLHRPLAKDREDVRQYMKMIQHGMSEREWIFWGIAQQDNAQLVGTICLWNISWEQPKAEIGYELLPSHQGKGIMQEALISVLDYGFSTMQLRYIEAVVDPNNLKSIQLLEKNQFKRVFTQENKVKNSLITYYLYP